MVSFGGLPNAPHIIRGHADLEKLSLSHRSRSGSWCYVVQCHTMIVGSRLVRRLTLCYGLDGLFQREDSKTWRA